MSNRVGVFKGYLVPQICVSPWYFMAIASSRVHGTRNITWKALLAWSWHYLSIPVPCCIFRKSSPTFVSLWVPVPFWYLIIFVFTTNQFGKDCKNFYLLTSRGNLDSWFHRFFCRLAMQHSRFGKGISGYCTRPPRARRERKMQTRVSRYEISPGSQRTCTLTSRKHRSRLQYNLEGHWWKSWVFNSMVQPTLFPQTLIEKLTLAQIGHTPHCSPRHLSPIWFLWTRHHFRIVTPHLVGTTDSVIGGWITHLLWPDFKLRSPLPRH